MIAAVSLATVEEELAEAKQFSEVNGWAFSPIDEEAQRFTVQLTSPVDQQQYTVEFGFDDYPEKPYLIEFFHPTNGQRGTPACYPKGTDGFFQAAGAICHPCSRKAYDGYIGLHKEWEMAGWQRIAGSLTRLFPILDAIYTRISSKTIYHGRMV